MRQLLVLADADGAPRGWLLDPAAGRFRCALGRCGVRSDKSEDDGATPAGLWLLRRVWYRADRLGTPPSTGLPLRTIGQSDGWCDDVSSPQYNRHIVLPSAARHERLWREDQVYDVVVELGYNDDPPIPARGSAIFLHVARPDLAPTQGCVALARDDLLAVLRLCRTGDALCVTAPGADAR